MNKMLAAWRSLQDTVVRHPLCRYTILPAGVVLAIWLVVLPMTAWNCWQEGLALRDFADGLAMQSDSEFFIWLPVTVGLMGILLTGRWLAVFIGLLALIFPMSAYDLSNVLYEYHREYFGYAIFWLSVCLPVVVCLVGLDVRSRCLPILPRWLRWLAVAAAGFCVSLVPASLLAEDCWAQCGLLESLMAGFLFTVFLDLAWRLSHDGFGRQLRGALAGLALGLYAAVYVAFLVSWLGGGFGIGLAVWILVVLLAAFLMVDQSSEINGPQNRPPGPGQEDPQ